MRHFASLLFAFAFAFAVLPINADDGDITNEDIVNEIKGTGGRARKPDHFLFNVKPASFLLANLADKGEAPWPYKCLQAKVRLFRTFGIMAEPVFVSGGYGGWGFTLGPEFFPTDAWEEMHIGPKYELDYIERMGAYHGLMVEMDRHYLFGHFTLTWGFAVGFGITGASAYGGGDGDSPIYIREIQQGLAYDVNLGLGFAL